MRYKVGDLVEVARSIDVDQIGNAIIPITDQYIGELGLITAYNEERNFYIVMLQKIETWIQVYEEEIEAL
jgi:hypothetical protein